MKEFFLWHCSAEAANFGRFIMGLSSIWIAVVATFFMRIYTLNQIRMSERHVKFLNGMMENDRVRQKGDKDG